MLECNRGRKGRAPCFDWLNIIGLPWARHLEPRMINNVKAFSCYWRARAFILIQRHFVPTRGFLLHHRISLL